MSEKRKVGRPSKYDRKFCKQAFRLSLLGSTNQQIADFFEVDRTTLKDWIDTFPEFCLAIKQGREQADANVAHALYKRAIGYKHKDVVITNYKGEIRETPVTKHYPPSESAAKFWLTNRKGATWKNEGQSGGEEDSELNDNEIRLILIRPEDEPEDDYEGPVGWPGDSGEK